MPLETLAQYWADMMDKVPGSFAPTVERLPDERILFSVHCGERNGQGRITVSFATDMTTPEILALVAQHVREEVAAACPYARRFLDEAETM